MSDDHAEESKDRVVRVLLRDDTVRAGKHGLGSVHTRSRKVPESGCRKRVLRPQGGMERGNGPWHAQPRPDWAQSRHMPQIIGAAQLTTTLISKNKCERPQGNRRCLYVNPPRLLMPHRFNPLLEVPELIAPLREDPQSVLEERHDDEKPGHGGHVRSDRLLISSPHTPYARR